MLQPTESVKKNILPVKFNPYTYLTPEFSPR